MKEKTKAEVLIPDSVQDFAAEFTALARRHGLLDASVTLRFGFRQDRAWDEPITIVWKDGRHGEDDGVFFLSTTLSIRRDLKAEAHARRHAQQEHLRCKTCRRLPDENWVCRRSDCPTLRPLPDRSAGQ